MMLNKIAEDIAQHGGRAFYAGGYVRDLLMKVPEEYREDIDIEVHNLNIEELKSILSAFGSVHVVGKSFPVVKIKGYPEWDFSLPRYAGIPYKEACSRRDFTINAMMVDVLTGELLDFFGGQEDIKNQVIRHTTEKVFAEDPLRAYRAVQFAGRLGFSIDTDTVELIKQTDLSGLKPERVFSELHKLLLLSEKPSNGLRWMQEIGILEKVHPELYKLLRCEQSPEHHPEGDVWEHTLLVVDQAARLKEKSRNPEALMLAALLHDIGKPGTTRARDGKITAYGHDVSGDKLARSFLRRFTAGQHLVAEVGTLVREHMQPVLLYKQKDRVGDKAIRKLVNRVNLSELLLLAEADFKGRTFERDFYLISSWLLGRVYALGLKPDERIEPLVAGKDLMAMGFTPGKRFTRILEYAFELQLEGQDKDEIMIQIRNKYKPG